MATAAVTHTFVAGTLIQSSQANTNFGDVVTFLNGSVMHRDASSAFTAVPSGPATDPSSDNQLVRKRWVDVGRAVSVQNVTGMSVGSALSLTTVTTWSSSLNTPTGVFTNAAGGTTILVAGWYELTPVMQFTTAGNTGNTDLFMTVTQNAAVVAQTSGVASNNVAYTSLSMSYPLLCAASDVIAVRVGNNSGATATVSGRFTVKALKPN